MSITQPTTQPISQPTPMSAHCTRLADGRWHFQQGPIDIVIGAEGEAVAVEQAHAAAQLRFSTVLQELIAELPVLRSPVDAGQRCPLQGRIAQRMWSACRPHAGQFITPMAAVAGAVAQELIEPYQRPGITRAWVNNGGDIALHLAAGQSLRVGLYADLARLDAAQLMHGLDLDGRFTVHAHDALRGIATSGWRGRSLSLGIADSVTILAATAAQADAAATVVANAVNVADAAIERRPAHEVKDDSDLGARLVTVHVPPLARGAVHEALRRGLRQAQDLRDQGLIRAALLVCQGQFAQIALAAPQALHEANPEATRETRHELPADCAGPTDETSLEGWAA